MNRAVILPQAKQDIKETSAWYESQQNDLVLRFLQAIRDKIDLIKETPEAYPIRFQDTRGAVMDKFPYWIFFKELSEKSQILIIAVLSCYRNPNKIEKRLK